MVIEGEALLNDGAAIVFFNVFLKLTTTEVGLSGNRSIDGVPRGEFNIMHKSIFCIPSLRPAI